MRIEFRHDSSDLPRLRRRFSPPSLPTTNCTRLTCKDSGWTSVSPRITFRVSARDDSGSCGQIRKLTFLEIS